jgi:FAD-dependent urate hydroxylase
VTQDLDVAVIGAGPYGLSTTVHLRRAGAGAQLFGTPMSFWQQMPNGMKLRSNMSATNLIEPVGPLSLKSYLDEVGDHQDWPVPLRRFIDYGQWVQRNGVPDLDQRNVARVERSGTGFRLELDDGEVATARRVVVAGGIERFKYLPVGFDQSDRISHTGDHSDLAEFAGKRVAVVGGGQSAFECATLMYERGASHVEVIVRSEDVVWLRSYSPKTLMGPVGPIAYAPTDVGPLWYSRLVATPALFRRLPRSAQHTIAYRSIRPACSYFVKVRLDEIKVSLGTEVTDVQETPDSLRVTVSDGGVREVDHLMFGTGYRVDVAKYPFLSETILQGLRRRNGYPLLRRGLESSVPRLHFVGAPASWSFGPILRFVSGSWYAGSSVARVAAGERSRGFALSRR